MNREQFISHVEGTQGALRRFLVALCCGDSALADDIAQETYIKAYLSCDNIRDSSRFTAWIYRIAYNTFVNARRVVRPTERVEAVADEVSSDVADDSFRYQELYNALDRLSGRERTAILLFYLEGYSIKEIAEIIDVSQDAVKQQLSRGRAHLKDMLSAGTL
ncbi:MAG: RNA polymerase sigma factor [Paenibacillus sp.]|nr:RNA polymerase sigma factor [Paenibacillus sp.]